MRIRRRQRAFSRRFGHIAKETIIYPPVAPDSVFVRKARYRQAVDRRAFR